MTQGLCFPESSAVTFLGNNKKVCGDPEVRWLDRWDLLPPADKLTTPRTHSTETTPQAVL